MTWNTEAPQKGIDGLIGSDTDKEIIWREGFRGVGMGITEIA